jgi:hypothetical protein
MVHRLVAESRMMKNCAPSAGVAGARIPRQINKRVVSMGQPHRWSAARSNYNIFAWCRSEVSLAFLLLLDAHDFALSPPSAYALFCRIRNLVALGIVVLPASIPLP